MKLPSLSALDTAADIVHEFMPATPQICWPLLCDRVGAEVWVKHENHTPLGAFKIRGGLVYFNELRSRHPDVTHVVALGAQRAHSKRRSLFLMATASRRMQRCGAAGPS